MKILLLVYFGSETLSRCCPHRRHDGADLCRLINQFQPGAVIFSDAGPDTMCIGDEAGVAGSTCWSLFDRSDAKIGVTNPIFKRRRPSWVPAECDVSILPGWFWHPSALKSARTLIGHSRFPGSYQTLLDIYYESVGRNCLVLLNVPPNSLEFSELRKSILSRNLAANALIVSSNTRGGTGDSRFDPYINQTNWILHLDLQESPIDTGQRIIEFHLEILDADEKWKNVANGTTVGYQRLLQFPTVKSES
ncbi:hypothetical protein UlMin_009358 [Ulmus minor]